MMRSRAGFTLLETIIVFTIMVGILLISGEFLGYNQKFNNTQRAETITLSDARYAMNRISDQLSKAVYIYPPNVVITLPATFNGAATFTTGKNGIAFLIPDLAVNNPSRYDVVAYYVADRGSFIADLPPYPNYQYSPYVLVEVRSDVYRTVNGIVISPQGVMEWQPNTLPSVNYTTNPVTDYTDWSSLTAPTNYLLQGVLADTIDASLTADTGRTNLMAQIRLSSTPGIDSTLFAQGIAGVKGSNGEFFPTEYFTPNQTSNGNTLLTSGDTILIRQIRSVLALNLRMDGKQLTNDSATVLESTFLGRNIPRLSNVE